MNYRSVILLFSVALFGCRSTSTSPSSAPSTYTGASVTIGTGRANSWMKTDATGKVVSVGISITDAALAGLAEGMLEVPIPTGVSSAIKSIALDYATTDSKPYDKPHLDPHFFLDDMNGRMGIGNGMDGMTLMNMTMPAGFVTDSLSETMMGTHWMDTTAAEYHGSPFQCAFVYGSTKGKMEFYEVMCDKASLVGHKPATATIRQPMMMGGMSMSMPSSYQVSYDAAAMVTHIELDGF